MKPNWRILFTHFADFFDVVERTSACCDRKISFNWMKWFWRKSVPVVPTVHDTNMGTSPSATSFWTASATVWPSKRPFSSTGRIRSLMIAIFAAFSTHEWASFDVYATKLGKKILSSKNLFSPFNLCTPRCRATSNDANMASDDDPCIAPPPLLPTSSDRKCFGKFRALAYIFMTICSSSVSAGAERCVKYDWLVKLFAYSNFHKLKKVHPRESDGRKCWG